MNRASNVTRRIGARLISTSATNKNSGEFITSIQKDVYYKNLDAKVAASYVKPANFDEALPYESIPGPKPLPIIGNIWRFLPYVGEFYNIDLIDMQNIFRKRYGKIMAMKGVMGTPDNVFCFSPEDFETLHRNEGVFPIRDALKAFAYYRTVVRKDIFQDVSGLTTVHGKDWYNMRSKINPILMQPQTAMQYIESMDKVADDLINVMRQLAKSDPNGEMPSDFTNYLYRWAMETIGYIAVDRRLGCLNLELEADSEPQKMIKYVQEMFYLYYKIECLPTMWQFYSSKTWKRFIKVLDFMTFTFLKYINEAKLKFAEEGGHKKEHEMSVLQRLLKIDDKFAMTMAMDMLTAGVDTTGRTAGAALYYLAKNPEAQNKLRKEIYEILPNKDNPVTKKVLSEAHYLKAVVKETTRMAPIGVGNFRTTVNDVVLSGYQIPKGTNVLTCNLLACHSEDYFPKAKEFIPERWLRSSKHELQTKSVHPFVFLPFGFGPRSCIGKRIANLELEIVIAKIIRNFVLEWHHDDMTFQSLPLYGIAKPLKLHVKELKT